MLHNELAIILEDIAKAKMGLQIEKSKPRFSKQTIANWEFTIQNLIRKAKGLGKHGTLIWVSALIRRSPTLSFTVNVFYHDLDSLSAQGVLYSDCLMPTDRVEDIEIKPMKYGQPFYLEKPEKPWNNFDIRVYK
jgi:hypothetical protein